MFPFIYSAKFLEFNFNDYKAIILGFICFSLSSSIIYIINDICDIEKDKLDSKKKNRPLASGIISKKEANLILITLIVFLLFGILLLKNNKCNFIIFTYIILNIGYSLKWKKIPILDISLLSLFFVLRVFYGGMLLNIEVSSYLYLTTISAAYYFGTGKRLKEAQLGGAMRSVLKEYPLPYLESIVNIFLCMTMMFYSLWAMNYNSVMMNQNILVLSIFVVIAILLSYHYYLHKNTNGNPTDMLLENKSLIILGFIYCFLILLAFFV